MRWVCRSSRPAGSPTSVELPPLHAWRFGRTDGNHLPFLSRSECVSSAPAGVEDGARCQTVLTNVLTKWPRRPRDRQSDRSRTRPDDRTCARPSSCRRRSHAAALRVRAVRIRRLHALVVRSGRTSRSRTPSGRTDRASGQTSASKLGALQKRRERTLRGGEHGA